MVGKIIAGVVQFVLFLVTFALGSFVLHPFNVRTALVPTSTQTRVFVWDGLLMMFILYLLVLLIELLMKKIKQAGLITTVAFVLAALAGFLMKFGFLSIDRL